MELRQLRHFVGIAEAGSYTKGAQLMNVSQPALTRSVQLLEHRLDTTLFVRTPVGVELTESGLTLLRHANLVLNSLNTAQEEIRSFAKGGYGEVRIGLASLFTNMLVDCCIAKCIELDGNFNAAVQVGLYGQLERSLRDGDLDIIVSTTSESEARNDLEFTPICDVSSHIVARCDHPLANDENITIEKVRDAHWVTLNEPQMETFLAAFFSQSGLAAPKRKIRTSSLELLRNLIRAGELISFLPRHWIEADLKTNRLKILQVEGTPIHRTAGIITRPKSLLNKGAHTFIRTLKKIADKAKD